MSSLLFSKLGEIAVAWNEAEHIINRLLWLYLDTDAMTAEIVTKPMRATDREKLLGSLANAKEIDAAVLEEVQAALRICKICRENRNTVLHNAGGQGGLFHENAHEILTKVCEELMTATNYLKELQLSITRIIIDRAGRDTPMGEAGDESAQDELLPMAAFARPERPEKPSTIAKADILPEGYYA